MNNKSKLGSRVATGLFLLIGLSIVITAQVIGDTQVIDLAEKARDFFIEATKGNIIGQQTGNQFGENLVVGVVFEDIQSQGGILVFLEAAETMDIVSTDTVNDISGGANAHSVLIKGLDENFTEIEEVVLLAAVANTTVNEYIRIQSSEVLNVGTYGASNAGIISVTASVSATSQSEIPLGESKSSSTHYTVPLGQKLILSAFSATMDTGKAVDLLLHSRPDADVVAGEMSPEIIFRTFRGLATLIGRRSLGNLNFDEKTDIWFSAATTSGGQSASVEVNYDFIQYAIGS